MRCDCPRCKEDGDGCMGSFFIFFMTCMVIFGYYVFFRVHPSDQKNAYETRMVNAAIVGVPMASFKTTPADSPWPSFWESSSEAVENEMKKKWAER